MAAVEDAMLAGGDAPIPPASTSASVPGGSGVNELGLLFVQDVIEPVTRAAQAVAQARCVG